MILDTCALLWLAEGGERLTPPVRARLSSEPVVYVSAIAGFEIGVKWAARKLALPVPPAEWLAAVVEHHALTVVPLDLETCVAATQLPPVHRDPCDRFVIATARRNRWPVVTVDEVFRQYDVEVLW